MIIAIQSSDFYKNRAERKISFGEGKVDFYSDFDRTYFPSTQDKFKKISNSSQDTKMDEYFQGIKKFFNKTREGLKFTITTGRNFSEFETIAEMARERNFNMMLPDFLIVKNGSDRHKKTGADEEFYAGGKFPFSYKNTDKEKEEKIKQLTNWDGAKIKAKLKEMFKEQGFDVREYPTTHSISDYGKKSALYEINNSIPNVSVFREDGNLKIFYSSMNRKSRKINDAFKEYLKKENINFAYYRNENDNEFKKCPSENYSPNVGDGKNGFLTKLYDTQQAIKKAAKENDLVVIAGDGSNDFGMLNPANYLKESLGETLWEFKNQPDKIVEEMDKNPELAKKFQELPFVGIVVKNKDDKNSKLESLIRNFGEGKYKKIIVVEEGHLLNGIKQSIKMYAEQKSYYMTKLSSDLKKEIFDTSATESKSHAGWIIAGVAGFIGIVGGAYLKKQNKKAQENQNGRKNLPLKS